MCGFSGFIDFSSKNLDYSIILDKCNEMISFRGPDQRKKYLDHNNKIFINFNRLSFLDLSDAGNQPMLSKDKRFLFLMNGEIYNFSYLYKLLSNSNILANNKSDTSVSLEFISKFGLDFFLKNAIGMFAIVLIDLFDKTITFLSDPFSQKPLYYSIQNNSLFFSSDLRSIRSNSNFNLEIDKKALSEYFRKSFISAPLSIYKNIFKLEQGSKIDISFKNNQLNYLNISKKNNFILPKEHKDNVKINFNEIQSTIEKSVLLHLEADVPIGTFLSSGLDSSLITAIASKHYKNLKAFSLGFRNKYFDEANDAKLIADHLKIEHQVEYFDDSSIIDKVQNTSQIYSEPFADSSQIPYNDICKFSSKSIKGILSGDGGDEIFGGYYRHLNGALIYKNTRNKFYKFIFNYLIKISNNKMFEIFLKYLGYSYPLEKINRLKKAIFAKNIDEFYYLLTSHLNFEDIVKNLSIRDEFINNDNNLNLSKYLMFKDLTYYLPNDLLVKSDRASMYNSLEVRSPFLNKDLVEKIYSFDSDVIFKGNKNKSILRTILKEYIPDKLISKKKRGFVAPINEWLKNELKELCEYHFSSKMLPTDLLNESIINENINDFYKGKNNHVEIWNLLIFQIWFHKYH